MWGAAARQSAPVQLSDGIYVNRPVAAGRLTRFWSKEDGAGDDGDPDDNPDESPLDAFLVHGASPPFAGSEPTAPMYAAAPREPVGPRPKDGFILPNFTVFVK